MRELFSPRHQLKMFSVAALRRSMVLQLNGSQRAPTSCRVVCERGTRRWAVLPQQPSSVGTTLPSCQPSRSSAPWLALQVRLCTTSPLGQPPGCCVRSVSKLDRAISELVSRFVWWCWWVRELFSPRHQFKTRSLSLQVVSCLISTGCVSLGSTRANPGAVPSPRVAPLSFAILACSLRVSLSRPTRHPSCGNLLLQLNRYPGQHEALAKSQRTHPLCDVL